MLSDHRKLKLSRYDLKIKPILLELLEYGLGQVALSNALNIRGVPTPSGKLQTVHSVRTTLERLGLTTTGK
ncbi:hypothetical protein [Erwinia billingiae]|uniref:hypothetical protein n=1 Tax=Erwinia billingiae TaxID=182337 RepID=UPI00320951FA